MSLTKAEEQIMEIIWDGKKIFFKEILEACPDPKPANSTVATLLKRMQDKGFIDYELMGNSRRYFPLIKKTDYFAKHVNGIVKDYFSNSPLQFASFFTKSGGMSASELEELKDIIDKELKKKQK